MAINRSLNRKIKNGKFKGYWEVDTTPAHFPIRCEYFDFVIKHFSNVNIILFLQEVDLVFVDDLRHVGFNCVYSQEDNSNRGGVAIVTKNPHITFDDTHPIYDSWTDRNGEVKRKHVGIRTLMNIGERYISVANLHLDAGSARESLPLVESLMRETNFIVGDFNIDMTQYARDSCCVHQYIDDLERKREGIPIDHILYSPLGETGISDLRMLTDQQSDHGVPSMSEDQEPDTKMGNHSINLGASSSFTKGSNQSTFRAQSLATNSDQSNWRAQSLAKGSNQSTLRAQSLAKGSNQSTLKAQSLSTDSDQSTLRAQSLAKGSDQSNWRAQSLAKGSDQSNWRAQSLAKSSDQSNWRAQSLAKGSDQSNWWTCSNFQGDSESDTKRETHPTDLEANSSLSKGSNQHDMQKMPQNDSYIRDFTSSGGTGCNKTWTKFSSDR
jgi:hypothetical protein